MKNTQLEINIKAIASNPNDVIIYIYLELMRFIYLQITMLSKKANSMKKEVFIELATAQSIHNVKVAMRSFYSQLTITIFH